MNIKVLNQTSITNETRYAAGMKLVNVNVDLIQVLVIIDNVEIMVNADADMNVKYWFTKEDVIKDL